MAGAHAYLVGRGVSVPDQILLTGGMALHENILAPPNFTNDSDSLGADCIIFGQEATAATSPCRA